MNRFALRSPRIRNIFWQALVVGAFTCLIGWLAWNAVGNFHTSRLGFGLDFLSRPANFPIGESLLPYAPGDTNFRAIVVGLLNSLLATVFAVILATLFGATLGIARLSGNYVASRLAVTYIELVRNIPLLAHLFIIYLLLQGLPPLRSAVSIGDVAFLSNRGLVIPTVHFGSAAPLLLAIAVALVLSCIAARRLESHIHAERQRLAIALGVSSKFFLFASLFTAVMGLVSTEIITPRIEGRSFVQGHIISPELVAIVLGLTIYYAAFIAEIVRSGIQSVPTGQTEAAAALGITPRQTLRLVILPQALRLMLPPVTSQYLDLAKMTSLSIVIGYPDLVAVANSIITDTGRAIECIAIIMTAFLLINLSISSCMNWLNRRVAVAGQTI